MPGRQLPARPNVAQYKKQAKDLLKAFRADEPDALRRVQDIRPDARKLALADAQFVIAREHGFGSWSRFLEEIGRRSDVSPASIWKEAENAVVEGDTTTLAKLLLEHEALLGPSWAGWNGS